MGILKAGFARVDITPPIGTGLVGYYRVRVSLGILDPLLATAVAVSDGENTAVMMSLDLIGIDQETIDCIRDGVAEKCGVKREEVFVACTHTHLAHGVTHVRKDDVENMEQVRLVVNKSIGVAQMAIADLKDAEDFINLGASRLGTSRIVKAVKVMEN